MFPGSGALLLACLAGPALGGQDDATPAPAGFGALAVRADEHEESLALALRRAMHGDCEGALARLATLSGGSEDFRQRLELEQERIGAWIRLRDAVLAELETDRKPLALVLDGKKVSTTFTRAGDELVLARGPRPRLGVRELQPEEFLPLVPKERFAGAVEWLKIWPYCVTGNAKWKRLTTSDSSSDALRVDAEDWYPRPWALGEVVEPLEALATRAPSMDVAASRSRMAEIEALLARGRDEPCIQRRVEVLRSLARGELERIAASFETAEFVHVPVSTPSKGLVRLTYDFKDPQQGLDWNADAAYLSELRRQLDPTHSGDESTRFAPGPQGFRGNGEVCWRHVLAFEPPARVRYRVRWEPTDAKEKQVFAFAVGILGDERERHVRCAELGFLYVDERDGRYLARRPSGDAVVQLGQTYEIELTHDGQQARVRIDGTERSDGPAKERKEGGVFLWCHSDLLVDVPSIEIEGRVTTASLERMRAGWVSAELARLGLEEER